MAVDAAVIGGGVIGLSIAYHLARLGLSVRLLEREDLGAGASGRTGGGVRQSARLAPELPLARKSVERFARFSEEFGHDIEYVREGNLRLVEYREHFRAMESAVRTQRDQGLDVTFLSHTGAVLKAAPFLNPQAVLAASYCPTDGHANPLRVVFALAERARFLGVKISTGAWVRRVAPKNGRWAIEVTGEEVAAGRVVLAAEMGSIPLAARLGVNLPIEPMRIQSFITEPMPRLTGFVFGTATADLFLRQTARGNFHYCGGYMAATDDLEVEPVSLAQATAHVIRLIPFLGRTSLIRTWGGVDGATKDKIPIIDRLGPHRKAYVAAGFCGHGFALAPTVGELVAREMATGRTNPELEPFRLGRFSQEKKETGE